MKTSPFRRALCGLAFVAAALAAAETTAVAQHDRGIPVPLPPVGPGTPGVRPAMQPAPASQASQGGEAGAVSTAQPPLERSGRLQGSARLARDLRAGRVADAGGVPLPREAQQAVLELVEDGRTGIAARLAAPGDAAGAEAAAALELQLRALFTAPDRLAGAVAAYNALVDVSTAEFLRRPPPEFLAVRAVLVGLTQPALATR